MIVYRYARRRPVLKKCRNCGKPHAVKPSALEAGEGKYCSRSCATSGKHNPRWKGGPSAAPRYADNFEARFPEKLRAHRLTHKAIERGELVRVPCVRCGSAERVHAHHEDYSKPLEVVWLCQPCHNRRHKEIREGRPIAAREDKSGCGDTRRALLPDYPKHARAQGGGA